MNTNSAAPSSPLHAEPVAPQGRPSGNPLGTSLNVVVSVPEAIEIRMVNASSLSDYEMWVFLASVLSNAVVGFVVATIQAYDSNATNACQLLMTAIVFGILFVATGIKAGTQRCTVTKTGKTIKLKATEATTQD